MKWEVSFDGGFWNNCGNTGTEVSINKSFSWGDEKWTVMAAYICKEGLVVDYSVEIDLEKFNAFLDKWDLRNGGYENLSRMEQEKIESEQPMNFGFRSSLVCNGKLLESCSGSSICWIPSSCQLAEGAQDTEPMYFINHYNLDENKAWVLWRCNYRWHQREEQIKILEISFEREKKRYAVSPIGNLEKGRKAVVKHPITGETYTVTALEVSNETYDESIFNNPALEYPTHFKAMSYSIEPEMEHNSFAIQDASEGDSPRRRERGVDGITSVSAISVFGGARSVAAINTKKAQTACSSMHFDSEFEPDWMPVFFIKELDDIAVRIER